MALLAALALGQAGCEPGKVQVVAVDVGAVESTATSIEPGKVKSRLDSSLSPPVSGRIVEVFHKEGDRVMAKEPIIRLENDLERIALEEAKLDLKRLKDLDPEGFTSKELLDRARFHVERAEVNFERTIVRAPFAGVLVELNAHEGEMSYGTMPLDLVLGGKGGGGKEAMARVVDNSQLYVEADIDEADLGRLKVGQPARIALEAFAGRELKGRLAWISQTISTAETSSRSVRVEIEIDEPGRGASSSPGAGDCPAPPILLVGMSADIEVILERAENAVRVPTLVVIEGEKEKSVFVVEEGRLRRRSVKVGASNWEQTEIKDGLRLGEWVVVPMDRKSLVEGKEVKVERREEKEAP